MNIGDFVAETLTQIATGVKKANGILAEDNAYVPSQQVNGRGDDVRRDNNGKNVIEVSFDIVVTTNASESNSKGGSIVVGNELSVVGAPALGIGWGKKRATSNENQNTHRIKFDIPLVLPDNKQST